MAAQRIKAAFARRPPIVGPSTLDLEWSFVSGRDLSLLIVAGEESGFEVVDPTARVDDGRLGVVDLSRGPGRATVAIEAPEGSIAPGSGFAVFICEGAEPIGRLNLDLALTQPSINPRSTDWTLPDPVEPARLDGVLMVCRATGAGFDLVVGDPGRSIPERFAHLGLLRYRRDGDDDASPLRSILHRYGLLNFHPTPLAVFDELGNRLWDLLPDRFKQRYWQSDLLRPLFTARPGGGAPAILILTDDWVFPWEMVTPTAGAAGANATDLLMLGRRAAIGHWRLGERAPTEVLVDRGSSWNSEVAGAGGISGDKETTRIGKFAAAFSPPLSFEGSKRPLRLEQFGELLHGSAGGWLHIRTHGTHNAIFINQFNEPGVIEKIGPPEIQGLIDADPNLPAFIFINACATDGEQAPAPSLVPQRRLAETLISGGSQGLVLTYWTINLTHGLRTVESFYTSLDGRASPAEAARVERDNALATGSSRRGTTPMAYVVYGHPSATVRPRNGQ